MKNILIFGANSDIAQSFAKLCASKKSNFFLVGRNEEALKNQIKILLDLGASNINSYSLDFANTSLYDDLIINILKV
jgi:short-subunit dehydrogenase